MNSITSKLLISVLGSITIILSIISASSYYLLKDKEETRFNQAIVDLSKQLEVILVDPIFLRPRCAPTSHRLLRLQTNCRQDSNRGSKTTFYGVGRD